MLAGCVDPGGDGRSDQTSIVFTGDVASVDLTSAELAHDLEPDVCALATSLARDNVCSLMCDPDELAARLAGDGTHGGRCVQLRCELPGAIVNVGVCLP